MMYPYYGGGFLGGFGWFFGVIFWVLIIWAVVHFIRHGSCGMKDESARDVLDKRYAKGEIKQEEYERMKKELTGQ